LTDTQKIVLHAENACKQYEMANGAALTAVSGVSFDISKGECLAVIGESGCGKSTLAKLVTGIEPLTDGKILFQDADIAKLGNAQMKNIRRNMQMIFQNAEDAISPRMKIGSFLMEPWINFRLGDKHAAQQKISEMLTKVRLGEDILNRYPHQLSGGELQRVCIARAFAMEPELLVCDEITSALDVSVQDDVMKLFRRIQTETGTACLMICHDLALVHSYSDRVMVMYLGQVVEMMNSLDLGVKALHPYTQGLLKAIFYIGSNRRGNPMQTLEGEPPSPINLPKGCCFCGRCSKATDICRSELPKLKQIASGHFVACHLL
jgi:oligopeptide/dipeptide ABC transporter ATP-binding protein